MPEISGLCYDLEKRGQYWGLMGGTYFVPPGVRCSGNIWEMFWRVEAMFWFRPQSQVHRQVLSPGCCAYSQARVADIRESPAENMVAELKECGVNVFGYDPLLTSAEIKHFGATPVMKLDKKMDAVIIAVVHKAFKGCRLHGFARR